MHRKNFQNIFAHHCRFSGLLVYRIPLKSLVWGRRCRFSKMEVYKSFNLQPKLNGSIKSIISQRQSSKSGRLYRGRWNALRSRWSMCDAEIDWHERAFRQNCSRSGFVNDDIFELLFSKNFNLWVTFIHCTNKEPSSVRYDSLFGMWTYIIKQILWRMVCCLDDLNRGNISK